MFVNEFGKIAEQQFNWLDQQYQYIELHSFVVMPLLVLLAALPLNGVTFNCSVGKKVNRKTF